MDQLRGWFDAQRAALRTPPTPTGEATPTADPTQTAGRAGATSAAPGRRRSVTALQALTGLVTSDLDAQIVAADVDQDR